MATRPKAPVKHSYRTYRAGRRWLVVLALLAVVGFHAVVIARLFLSPEQFRFRTQTFLQTYFPGKVTLGAAGYELPLGFRLGELMLRRSDEQGGAPRFSSKKLSVSCRILPLLRGKLSLEDVVFEGPELWVTAADLKPSEQPAKEVPEAPVQRVIVRRGRLHFAEGLLFADSPAQELRDVTLELTKDARGENAFEFDGSADSDYWGACTLQGRVDFRRRELEVTVTARGIPVDDKLREMLRGESTAVVLRSLDRYGLRGKVDLTVIVNVDWGEPKDLRVAATVDLVDCEAKYERIPLPLTGVSGRITIDRDNAYLKSIQATAGRARIEISGRTSNLRNRDELKAEVHVNIRDRIIDDALYEAISQYVHPRTGKHVLKDAWDRCGLKGGMLSLEYHSTWWRKDRRHQGQAIARVRDAVASYTKFPYPLDQIAGTVRWEQGVTTVDKLVGRHGKAIVEINGSLADKGVPDLTIRATDVPFDQVLRNALSPGVQKAFDELHPKGVGAADVRVTCPSGDPKKLDYRITIKPLGASFQHDSYPHRFTNVRGRLEVDETGAVTLRDLQGSLGDIPVTFAGTVARDGETRIYNLTVTASEVELGPAARALVHETAKPIYDQLEPLGKVRVTWRLFTDRATKKLRNAAQVHCLRDCSIQHKMFPLRVEGLMGDIYIEGSGRSTFTGMRGRIGRAAIEALEGEYSPGKEGLRFKLRGRGMALDDRLRRALPKPWQKAWDQVRPAGEANVEYQYRHNPDDPEQPIQRVTVEPAGASFRPTAFPLEVTDVSRGVVAFDQDGNAKINNVQGKYRGRTVSLSGDVTAGAKGSVLTLDVSAAELGLDKQVRDALPREWQEIFDDLHLAGIIGADAQITMDLEKAVIDRFRLDAKLKGCETIWTGFPVRLTGLRGRLEYDNGVSTLYDVAGQSGSAQDVTLNGTVAGPGSKAPTRLKVVAHGVQLVPELRKALPPEVRQALDDMAFQGTVDVDLTVTRSGEGAKTETGCFGTMTLHECAFERGYPFRGVSGEVRITRARLAADGTQAISGSLGLHKLRVKDLPASEVRGQFTYTRAVTDGKPQPAQLDFKSLSASFCGGRAAGKATVGLGEKGPFEGVLLLQGIDFKEFCVDAARTKYRASGVLNLRLEMPPGEYKKEKGFVGDGWATVSQGQLGDLPLAAALLSLLRLATPKLGMTDAHLKFGIAKDHLVVKELLLGQKKGFLTRGYGTIGFDGALDLKFVAQRQGRLFTVITDLVFENLVQYEVRGTLSKPKPNTKPLPVTTTIFDEIKRGFGLWDAIFGTRSRPEGTPEE